MTRNTVANRHFRSESGVVFTVTASAYHPKIHFEDRQQKYLATIESGCLLGLSIAGRPLPFITTDKGAISLGKIETAGKTYATPNGIAVALGLRVVERPQKLEVVEQPNTSK